MNNTNTISVTETKLAVKTNVLIVDDRPEGLLALEAVLSCDRLTLVKASSGREALQQALYNDFAVILLDVQMPELDGFQTAQLLRENYRSKTTPIIFVTAISKEAIHINQGYESGAVDYIFKPLDPFILKSKVEVFVDLFNKNLQIKEQSVLLRKLELQEKERQMAELRQDSLRRYANLADAVPHMILRFQTDGTVEYFNRGWEEFTAFNSKLTSDWNKIIHYQDRRKFLALWLRMRHQIDRQQHGELRIRNAATGTYSWHLISIVAEMQNEKITGWIVTCINIDYIKKTEEKYRLLSEELNRSNKELEEFAYVASHDIREPLHVISSFASLLEKNFHSALDAKGREYMHFIKQGAQQAQNLIKELLEYSRIGKQKYFEVVDLSSILGEIFIRLKLTIEESGAAIKYDPMPRVLVNHLEMVQLFQNLISNAIKYRGSEPPEISISVRPHGRHWLFCVKDNGIGIEPQYKDQIFVMFQRFHRDPKYTGSGVGLAICKKIVENHGGKIWVESQPGEGSAFYFTLKC